MKVKSLLVYLFTIPYLMCGCGGKQEQENKEHKCITTRLENYHIFDQNQDGNADAINKYGFSSDYIFIDTTQVPELKKYLGLTAEQMDSTLIKAATSVLRAEEGLVNAMENNGK